MKVFYQLMTRYGPDYLLNLDEFNEALAECLTVANKCIVGGLRCPDFREIVKVFEKVYETVILNENGENANYIPELAKVNPDQFSISFTTTDGQHFSLGDSDVQWCIQSCSKPLSYLLALDNHGEDYVHHHVGTEASGRPFNDMCLKRSPIPSNPDRSIPHNPCVNAGAILIMSMVAGDVPDMRMRLNTMLDFWRDLSAGHAFDEDPIGYDHPTYISESGTANRNWCLAYMMLEAGSYPSCFLRHTRGERMDKMNLRRKTKRCSNMILT